MTIMIMSVLLVSMGVVMADTTVWEIGVFDNAYNPLTDGTKITTLTDRSVAPTGTSPVDYENVSTFYSVLVPVTNITGTFDADLSEGATLLVSWSPGKSYPSEQFSVTLGGTTVSSKIVPGLVCDSSTTFSYSDGRCGGVPSYYSGYSGLPYYTETFDFGSVGSGTEAHTLTISYPQGDGIGFDYLRLSTPEREYTILESTLLAGQHIDAGTLTVTNDGINLYVEYQTTDGWEMTETHLDVTCKPEDFPQTKKGNPKVGQFAYFNEYDPAVILDTYTISFSEIGCNAPFYIAAHAVVQKVTMITPTPYYASSVFDFNQGSRKDGTLVRAERSEPEQGLAYETGQDEQNFFSLGFDGWVIMEFDYPIINGDGNDVRVIEDTWGSYPLEKAEVWASQDNNEWTFLGEADNTNNVGIHTIALFDLGSLEWAKYIKIVDISDPNIHSGTADGYDLNAVESLQDCVEVQEETAWGDKVGIPFSGNNWAMYLKYLPELLLVDTVQVYANDPNSVESNIDLKSGVQYELEAMGTAFAGDTIDFDAKYSITDRISGDTWTDLVSGYESYGTKLLNLLVDGVEVDWGTYNDEHTYYYDVTGIGIPIELLIYDICYPNNEDS